MISDEREILRQSIALSMNNDGELASLLFRAGEMGRRAQSQWKYLLESFAKDGVLSDEILGHIEALNRENFFQAVLSLIWMELDRQSKIHVDQRSLVNMEKIFSAFNENAAIDKSIEWELLFPIPFMTFLTGRICSVFGEPVIGSWVRILQCFEDNFDTWIFPIESIIENLTRNNDHKKIIQSLRKEMVKYAPDYTVIKWLALSGEYDQAREKTREIQSDIYRVKALLSVVEACWEAGDLQKTESLINQIDQLVMNMDSKIDSSICLGQLVGILIKTGDDDRAIHIALDLIPLINNNRNQALVSAVQSIAGKGMITESIRLSREIDSEYERIPIQVGIAVDFMLEGEREKAEKYIDEIEAENPLLTIARALENQNYSENRIFFNRLMNIATSKGRDFLSIDLLVHTIAYTAKEGTPSWFQEIIDCVNEYAKYEDDLYFRDLQYHKPVALAFLENGERSVFNGFVERMTNNTIRKQTLNEAAVNLLQSGENQQALKYFSQSADIDYFDSDVEVEILERTYRLRALINSEMKNYDDAKEAIEEILLPFNQSRAWTDLALSLVENGLDREAERILDYIEFDFERAEALAEVSSLYKERGDQSRAERSMKRAFSILDKLSYNIEITKIEIAGQLIKSGLAQEAVELLSEARESLESYKEENHDYKARYLRKLGDSFFAAGESLRAKEVYDHLSNLFGGSHLISYEIKKMCFQAEFYNENGEDSKTVEMYRRVLDFVKKREMDMHSLKTIAESVVKTGHADLMDWALGTLPITDSMFHEFLTFWQDLLMGDAEKNAGLIRKSFQYFPFEYKFTLNNILLLILLNLKLNRMDISQNIISCCPDELHLEI